MSVVHGDALIQFASHRFDASSRWFVGSSSKSSPFSPDPAGDRRSLASATRICHPPERSSHRTSHCVRANPSPSSTLAILFSASYPPAASNSASASMSESAALHASTSSVDSHAFSAASSAALALLMRCICERASSYTVICEPLTAVCSKYPTSSSFAMAISPSWTLRRPAMHLSRVDLPHPLPPTRPTTCPGMTATDASVRRSTSPTDSMTSVMRSAAPEVLP